MLPIAAPRNYNDKILIVTALPIDEPPIAESTLTRHGATSGTRAAAGGGGGGGAGGGGAG